MNKCPFTESVRGIYGSLGIPRLTHTTDTRLSFRQVARVPGGEAMKETCLLRPPGLGRVALEISGLVSL